jgi:hypothetical protein
MASPGCQAPRGWSMQAAAPTYSAFAGVLCGFLFLGITTLMTTDRREPTEAGKAAAGAHASEVSGRVRIDRTAALMLFLPAFLCLVVSCFLFGEVSGDQVCARGDIGGLFASSFLAVGTLGIFGGISWMLDAYGESNEELRRASAAFIYISYCIVMSALLVYAEDFSRTFLTTSRPVTRWDYSRSTASRSSSLWSWPAGGPGKTNAAPVASSSPPPISRQPSS